jgi:hypothetical protein
MTYTLQSHTHTLSEAETHSYRLRNSIRIALSIRLLVSIQLEEQRKEFQKFDTEEFKENLSSRSIFIHTGKLYRLLYIHVGMLTVPCVVAVTFWTHTIHKLRKYKRGNVRITQ